jgi:predicted esterase
VSFFEVLNLVQEEIKNGIPAERIIIGGFSQGGATALYTALTSSMRFGGVLALSTWLPLHHRFPAQLKQCENLASLPIFQAHGDADAVVPFDWSQMSVKALNALGFTDVRFKPYHGLSHSSNDEEMRDVNDFIKNIFPN